jgi:formiminotetrahydrofolate cyclodeaminase
MSIPDRDQLLDRWIAARDRLMSLVDANAVAIRALIHARRLGTEDPARQAAYEAIMGIPLEAAELCHTVAIEAQPLLKDSQSEALPDDHVGIQLVEACQRAMCGLVQANLGSWTDAEWDTAGARHAIERAYVRLERLAIDSNGDREIT